jgi:glycerophosphoryl diester phosphodiesterase
MGVLRTIKAFSWHPRRTVLTREQVERVHAEGMKIFPWTINTEAEAEALLGRGVDGLICNELLAMRAA